MSDEAFELSLVIPAFNEGQRLPPLLHRVRPYLIRTYGTGYEVLVVDDGSWDDLGRRLGPLRAGWPELLCLRHTLNQGKGAAVRTGVLAARGRLILFSDADGATPFEEESHLRRTIEAGADVAVGSRLLPGPSVSRSRTWCRNLTGSAFSRLVRAVSGLPVRDTQCGFKMFRREVGQRLFRLCREPGYLFDIEVLALAWRLGYRIAEVPVRWNEMPGSKVRLLRDGWEMAWGLLRLRRAFKGSRAGRARSAVEPAKWRG